MNITIINGPNLNLLGKRERSIYGNMGFNEYMKILKKKYKSVKFTYFQSNIEGELINKIQECAKNTDGVILNAAGYTHTSVAIADAVAAIKTPVIEVHISNIFSREDHRHVSYLGKNCKGSISGFGLRSYDLAIQYFLEK